MFGANALQPRAHEPLPTLLVQGRPFHTIQGEGPLAGMPATFIRLWGCHLQCWFCDTDFESEKNSLPVRELVNDCMANPAPLVVLTGGEPMRQNIVDLCRWLLQAGKLVQIETAGNFWYEQDAWYGCVAHPNFHIVVSPKGPVVNARVALNADAWKYVVSADYTVAEDDGLPVANTQQQGGPLRRLARPPGEVIRARRDIYLQPMDQYNDDKNKANSALCVELALRYGYRVSVQLHKQWGLP